MNENISVKINQSVAILIDGNNIELSLHNIVGEENALLDFNKVVPKLLDNRGLNRLIYFREGKSISSKLAERLLNDFHGSVMPCHKSADIPLTIKATQIAKKVDTIIILSGDSDYVELVRHLRGEGVRVEIAAVRQTTARILIEEADHFTPITEEDCYILKSSRSKPTNKPRAKPKPKTVPSRAKKAASITKPAPRKKTTNTKKESSPKPKAKTTVPRRKKVASTPASKTVQQKRVTKAKQKTKAEATTKTTTTKTPKQRNTDLTTKDKPKTPRSKTTADKARANRRRKAVATRGKETTEQQKKHTKE